MKRPECLTLAEVAPVKAALTVQTVAAVALTIAVGLKAFRHGGLIHPYGLFTAPERRAEGCYVDLTGTTAEAYLEAPRAMPELGLTVYDLGVGHDHYKRPFAASLRQVSTRLQSAPGGKGALNRTEKRAWRLGPLARLGARIRCGVGWTISPRSIRPLRAKCRD